ncbi:MAG: polynucleotide adenylyltransferase [Chloroflexaceae bacterium]|nr:polynucleotide adenylyltransferase [Chloroflexaceae bacterium]
MRLTYHAPQPTAIDALLAHARVVTHVLDAQHLPWRIVGGAVRELVCGDAALDVDIEVVASSTAAVWAQLVPFFAHALLIDTHKPVIRIDSAGQFHDPCQGLTDLQAGVIRHLGDAFIDDPLRVLRMMRFAGMYDLQVAPATAVAAHHVSHAAAALTRERVWGEWYLWATRSSVPSAGLAALRATGWLLHYPMLANLVGCPQDPVYHPEGDVWVHTGHVCDAVVRLAQTEDVDERLVIMIAALCHDLGKPATTATTHTRIVSPGHAQAGMPVAAQFLTMIHAPARTHTLVIPLVGEHMVRLGATPSERAVRRLAQRLNPATIALWGKLVAADGAGRPPLPANHDAHAVLVVAEKLGIRDAKPVALVRGHDVLASGVPAGALVGEWLRRAYEAQLDGVFATHTAGVAWLQQQLVGTQISSETVDESSSQ